MLGVGDQIAYTFFMVSKELKAYLKTLATQFEQSKTTTKKQTYAEIVNLPFTCNKLTALRLGLGIIVLLLVNDKKGTIDRIALSKTDFAQHALDMSQKRFEDIKIPLKHSRNIISKAISNNKPYSTTDWELLFTPDMPAQAARFNQAAAGIECSFVYPLTHKQGGALIFSYFLPNSNIGASQQTLMETYSKLVTKRLSE